jgi:hypothetical protein
VRNGFRVTCAEVRGNATAASQQRWLWTQETGGQILPCFTLSGSYCRELWSFGIKQAADFSGF